MGLGAGLLQAAAAADNQPAAPQATPVTVSPATNNLMNSRMAKPPAPAPLPPGFKDQKEQMSYSIGMSIARNVKQGGIDLDMDVLTAAMKDALAGGTMRMTEEQMKQGLGVYQTAARAKQEEERMKTAEKNRKAGDIFLAENKKKEGVKTLTVALPGGKTAEMQYKIITEGTGEIPKSNDFVTVKYRGTTIDGKEFDNTSKRGTNAVKMAVSRATYKGWTEAWERMKVGSKWELYIPSTLAGGDRPVRPNVEGGSTLIFEMELTGIAPPPSPRGATNNAAPLTSDVIKVPSAEDIKKGAVPKVLTQADIEKEMQKAKANETNSAKAVLPAPGAQK